MVNLGIIIVHYKSPDITEKAIISLNKADLKSLNAQIILINNSKDNLPFLKRISTIPLTTINNSQNLGFAEGCNVGIRTAMEKKVDYLLFLNPDTFVAQNTLQVLIESFDKERVGLVSPKIYFAKGHEFHHKRYTKKDLGRVIWYAGGTIDWKNVYAHHRGVDDVDRGQFNNRIETDYVTGCCMMVHHKVFQEIGLLDPNYFVYYEDVDLSVRAKKKGFKIMYEPKTHIFHKNALSSNKPGSALHVYFQTRNRYYFALKYAPTKTKLHILKEIIIKLMSDDRNIRLASFDIILGKMGKGSYIL
ncbi:glycosyltransferase family 2 protein [Candidatus Gottesmanbacteria bacterium]|nr:glycosyltransferase family 2 protein [Candidatus Gottesmanbacteria bacterium]